MGLLFFWVVIFFISLLRYNNRLIFYLPSYIIISKLSTQILGFSHNVRAVTLIDYAILFFVLFVSIIDIYNNRKWLVTKKLRNKIYLFTLLMVLLLVITTSNIWDSFKTVLVVVSYLLVYLALIEKSIPRKALILGIKQVLIYSLLIGLNFIVMTSLSIGPLLADGVGKYSAGFLRIGGFDFFDLHGIAIIASLVLVFNKILDSKTWKIINIVSFAMVVLLLYFTYKRTYLVEVVVGLMLFYLSNILFSKKSVKNLIIATISISVIYITFSPFIESYIDRRSNSNKVEALENAGRLLEFQLYPEVVGEREHPGFFLLFGTELFNSRGEFQALNPFGFQRKRSLHNDYSHLLYETGIVGLLIYLSFVILNFKFSYKRLWSSDLEIRKYAFATMIVSVNIFVISGLADGFVNFHSRFVPLFILGLLIGVVNTEERKYLEE